MNIDIVGKVVVVTGAAQGIGRTLALGLGADGARVAVLAPDRKRAQLVVDEIEAAPDRVQAVVEEIEAPPDQAPVAVEEVGAPPDRAPVAVGTTGALPN